jgi:hypothetical protein
MPPQLRQLNVSYIETEDRLFLKVSTSEDEEYRVWCTRRFTRVLMDRLEETFQTEMPSSAAVPEPARREVARMQHQQSVTEESFQQPYQAEPTGYPLGEDGLLVTSLKYSQQEDKTVQLFLGDNKGVGITLNLNEHLKHQLYELFARAAEKADWYAGVASEVSAVVH